MHIGMKILVREGEVPICAQIPNGERQDSCISPKSTCSDS